MILSDGDNNNDDAQSSPRGSKDSPYGRPLKSCDMFQAIAQVKVDGSVDASVCS